MGDIIKRLREGQIFHCPDCGFGFPVRDPTAAAEISDLRRAKKRLIQTHRKAVDWEKKLNAEIDRLTAELRDKDAYLDMLLGPLDAVPEEEEK